MTLHQTGFGEGDRCVCVRGGGGGGVSLIDLQVH